MSTVVVGTIQSNSTSPPTFNNTNGTEIGTLCRAFCNFNGTSTVAIRASFNVSSITDNGTGDYTVNFTTAFADANYDFAITAGTISGNYVIGTVYGAAPTSSQFRINITNLSSTPVDTAHIGVTIFR
jgi:hypothetical protein